MDGDPQSILLQQDILQAGIVNVSSIISISVLLLLLLISALVSGSEAAFFSLTPHDKDFLNSQKEKKYWYANHLIERPKALLATILVVNNLVNVGIVILSSFILHGIFQDNSISEAIRFAIEVIAITLVLLLVGEVIPKIYATKNALNFSVMMGRALYYTNKIPPISWISKGLVKGTKVIQKRTGKGKVKISTGDLQQALELTKEESTSEDEHKILEGIIKFGSTEVSQIMRPRMEVKAIDIQLTNSEVLETILECGHSRIPVFKETFDNIEGILVIKDLLPYMNESDNYEWSQLIRKPFFVTENKKIDDLLKEFQEKKVHIAMVVDEYGGTSGIVTLEDVLEEIVGDITDEFDDEEIIYTKINEKTYLFEGRTSLVDFLKVMDLKEGDFDFENNTADTLGGFIVEQAGRILMNNEFIETNSLKLVVESSDKKRIKMVKTIIKEN